MNLIKKLYDFDERVRERMINDPEPQRIKNVLKDSEEMLDLSLVSI